MAAPTPAVTGYPPRELQLLLRLEGAVFAAIALYLFTTLDVSWWLFAALILAPDLSALGFLAGKATGARIYNLAHLWVWPAAVSLAGYLVYSAEPAGSPVLLGIGLIWAIHIGADRALGYGLKQPASFELTHLGPIGRMRRAANNSKSEGAGHGAA